jgi:hypothetical protein
MLGWKCHEGSSKLGETHYRFLRHPDTGGWHPHNGVDAHQEAGNPQDEARSGELLIPVLIFNLRQL